MSRCTLTLTACLVLVGLLLPARADAQAAAPQSSSAAVSAPSAPCGDGVETRGLKRIDWAIIIGYAAATIGLGWYYSRRQASMDEYFVGSGNMNPVLVGISLFATLLSTISFLSVPGEMIGKGPVTLVGILTYPLAFLIVGFLLIPLFMRQRATSAYALLEEKLGLECRLLGAVMFILLRLVWMSLLVHVAAKAMTVMMGVEDKWIPLIVLITGLVAVTYTSLGGMRAVVITDLLQSILLLGGALMVIVLVTIDFGGFQWFPTSWQSNWDSQPLISLDPGTRVTVLGSCLAVLLWQVCTAGGDQTAVQRFMSTRDAQAARRSYFISMLYGTAVLATLSLVGFALLGYFRTHAAALPADISVTGNADQIFPHFIAFYLPPGVSGLVVAAMFAAAMSSLDSGVNSITAVVMTDFVDRFGLRPKTQKRHLLVAKLMAFTIGAIVVVGTSFMKYVPGNITAVTTKTGNLLVTPIFALFFFALFVPFARPAGVIAGAICGTTTAALIAFSGPIVAWLATHYGVDPELFGVKLLTQIDPQTDVGRIVADRDPVSFQWIAPVALGVNLLTGTLVSLILPRRRHVNRLRGKASRTSS